MTFYGHWFDSGRIADGYNYSNVKNNSELTLGFQKKTASWAGLSGWIEFKHKKIGKITIAFSNPKIGYNKIATAFNCDS